MRSIDKGIQEGDSEQTDQKCENKSKMKERLN